MSERMGVSRLKMARYVRFGSTGASGRSRHGAKAEGVGICNGESLQIEDVKEYSRIGRINASTGNFGGKVRNRVRSRVTW